LLLPIETYWHNNIYWSLHRIARYATIRLLSRHFRQPYDATLMLAAASRCRCHIRRWLPAMIDYADAAMIAGWPIPDTTLPDIRYTHCIWLHNIRATAIDDRAITLSQILLPYITPYAHTALNGLCLTIDWLFHMISIDKVIEWATPVI